MDDSSHNMRTNNLDFRSLLLKLQDMKKHGFTSVDVAIFLHTSRKRVSNDLARLYRMGFLRRERQKRVCISDIAKFRNFKSCHKGYEYTYAITRQGLSYINWLRNDKPIVDLRDLMLEFEILENLPEDVKNELSDRASSKLSSKYKGPQSKPLPIDIDILTLLMSENFRLRKRNSDLNSDYNVAVICLTLMCSYSITQINRLVNHIDNLYAIITALMMKDLMPTNWANFQLHIRPLNEELALG